MSYGKLGDQVNKNISAAMVKAATGMSLNDYAQQTSTTTGGTFSSATQQELQIQELQRRMSEMDTQAKIERAQMQAELTRPFDETEDFRDFMVWLCGFTARHELPSQEDWENLREESKKVAAKFALATRARRTISAGIKSAYENVRPLSGNGITGNQTLVGNEEWLSGCTNARQGWIK